MNALSHRILNGVAAVAVVFFAIAAHSQTGNPKWLQPVDCVRGISVSSCATSTNETVVADDFVSDGRPAEALRWWGSYSGWKTDVAPDGNPVEPPSDGRERPEGFIIRWYGDVPSGTATNYSFPGHAAAEESHDLSLWGDTNAAVVETYYTSVWHDVEAVWEHQYVCHVALTNCRLEEEGSVCWLSVQADYGSYAPTNAWGWGTTPLERHFNGSAVETNSLSPADWDRLAYSGVRPGHPYGDNSVDAAFEIYTGYNGRRARKWRLVPDTAAGVCMPAFCANGESGRPPWPVQSDDFTCDGRRIAGIRWWGAYCGWQTNNPAVYPVPHPSVTAGPKGFWLSRHMDAPTNEINNYSMPSNPAMTRVFVPMDRCHETYFETVLQNLIGLPPSYEHVYRYDVDLLDAAITNGGAWNGTNGAIYWIDIQAEFKPGWSPGDDHYGWGWYTSYYTEHTNGVSAGATNCVATNEPDWEKNDYPLHHPYRGVHPVTLAFELTTDQPGLNAWYDQPAMIGVDLAGSNVLALLSTGDLGAGIQVLQEKTNMLTTNWVDVCTNPTPVPRPFTNNWYHAVIPDSPQGFYRLQQR